jgi:hypothetical protein
MPSRRVHSQLEFHLYALLYSVTIQTVSCWLPFPLLSLSYYRGHSFNTPDEWRDVTNDGWLSNKIIQLLYIAVKARHSGDGQIFVCPETKSATWELVISNKDRTWIIVSILNASSCRTVMVIVAGWLARLLCGSQWMSGWINQSVYLLSLMCVYTMRQKC